jgi:putative two-component system response regulator
VASLACAFAREMGLPEERVEVLRIAGVLHDIGKIQIPAEILSKPSRLSDSEFNLIKGHAQIGYDIIKTANFPGQVADIVVQHHERRDGSGYPAGQQGEELLLESRILAVADVVEAMVSHRPCRPGLGIERALAEISQNCGVLYDPQAVDACLRLFAENRFSFDIIPSLQYPND